MEICLLLTCYCAAWFLTGLRAGEPCFSSRGVKKVPEYILEAPLDSMCVHGDVVFRHSPCKPSGPLCQHCPFLLFLNKYTVISPVLNVFFLLLCSAFLPLFYPNWHRNSFTVKELAMGQS